MQDKSCEILGKFITIEGADGVGKSTQVKLVHEYLKNRGLDVLLVREPGGTKIGEAIREIILSPVFEEMTGMTELLLYEASRAQLVQEVVVPALADGKIVLCDRFFDSSVAYQGYARELGASLVKTANELACGEIKPTITFLLSLEDTNKQKEFSKEMYERATQNGTDRLEAQGLKFQEKVHRGFLQIAKDEPERVKIIDARGSVQDVFAQIQKYLDELFD